MKKAIAIASLAVALALPATVVAAVPESPSCFGQSAAALAQSDDGAMGDHASGFESPRLGIGNVAYLFTGTHQPGVLAGLLGGDCGD